MTRYFGRVLAGLEEIVALQLKKDYDLEARPVLHRTVGFETDRELSVLLSIPYIEDLFIQTGQYVSAGPHRSALGSIAVQTGAMSFESALKETGQYRGIPERPLFSITVSFVGKRNYSRWDIADMVKDTVTEKFSGAYLDNRDQLLPEHDLNFRIILEGAEGLAGIRVSKAPLHKRPYRVHRDDATLNAPLAALMLRFAGAAPGGLVLDPFCGVGTVPLESLHQNAEVRAIGGDIDERKLRFFMENQSQINKEALIVQADAFRQPFPDGSIDAIVTDMPWGMQTNLSSFYGQEIQSLSLLLREFRRVLKPGGRVVVLNHSADLLCEAAVDRGFAVNEKFTISLHGQRASLVVMQLV